MDAWLFVLDVSGGEKVPRKGGPGVRHSDLLIINKMDLAPHVGADLRVMDADARAQRTVTGQKSDRSSSPTSSAVWACRT